MASTLLLGKLGLSGLKIRLKNSNPGSGGSRKWQSDPKACATWANCPSPSKGGRRPGSHIRAALPSAKLPSRSCCCLLNLKPPSWPSDGQHRPRKRRWRLFWCLQCPLRHRVQLQHCNLHRALSSHRATKAHTGQLKRMKIHVLMWNDVKKGNLQSI